MNPIDLVMCWLLPASAILMLMGIAYSVGRMRGWEAHKALSDPRMAQLLKHHAIVEGALRKDMDILRGKIVGEFFEQMKVIVVGGMDTHMQKIDASIKALSADRMSFAALQEKMAKLSKGKK